MRYLGVLIVLVGCAQGPLTTSGPNRWDTCISDKARVGDQISDAGRMGTVRVITGRSDRCLDPGRPIIASVEYEPLAGQSNVRVWERK